jgi:antitoxin component YwqK of YwqJK toxin-antitoxin module
MKNIFILLCFLFTGLTFGKPVKYPKTYTHYLNEKDGNVKVSVLAVKVNIRAKEELTYYWFHYNQVMSTKGGYDGYLLHGEFTAFYMNNNLKEKGIYKNGLREGKWMSWYENGMIREIAYYKNGMKNGRYQLYNELGQLMVKTCFRDNLVHGKMKTYSNNKIQEQKKFRHGKERVKKIRKTTNDATTTEPVKDKEQKKIDRKIKRETRKQLKEQKKKEKANQNDSKEKKPFKERIKNIFRGNKKTGQQ